MSGSNRGEKPNLVGIALAIVFGGLVVSAYWWMFYDMGASSAQYAFEHDQNRQAYAADTADQIKNDCVRLSGGAQLECMEKAIKASAEYQQSESDLNAQRGMSKWAFWLLIITGGQMLATIVGLVYLKGTLDQTIKAVEDTGDATAAMHRQNELTERESLPYISINEAWFTQTGAKAGFVEFNIENVGKSPGVDVYFTANMSGFMPEGQFYEERMRVGKKGGVLELPKDNRSRLGALGQSKTTLRRDYKNLGGLQNAIIASGFIMYDAVTRKTYYSKFFFYLGDHLWKMNEAVRMEAGGLQIDIFQIYTGPELRDRDGY
jgi:hypothetical protein